MLTFKQLEIAANILRQIQALDKEIVVIERLAEKVVNDLLQVKISFQITDLSKADKDDGKTQTDKDIELYEKMLSGNIFSIGAISTFNKKEDDDSKYEQELTETETLHVLSVLCQSKQMQRNDLIKRLEKYQIAQ